MAYVDDVGPSDAPDLEGLEAEAKVEAMVEWFRQNFEDPANSTPYDEGEYVYIWGGPYDARDEIEGYFGDQALEEEIEEAVDRVQSDGTFDWAPHERRIQEVED